MAFQVSQHNCCWFSRLSDLIQQGSNVGRAAIESAEDVALVSHPRVTLNTLNHDKFLEMVTIIWYVSGCSIGKKDMVNNLASQTVSFSCCVITYRPALPLSTWPGRNSLDIGSWTKSVGNRVLVGTYYLLGDSRAIQPHLNKATPLSNINSFTPKVSHSLPLH